MGVRKLVCTSRIAIRCRVLLWFEFTVSASPRRFPIWLLFLPWHGWSRRTLPALPMNFLDSTLRDWKVTLEPMAARKPGQLKVTCSSKSVRSSAAAKQSTLTMTYCRALAMMCNPHCLDCRLPSRAAKLRIRALQTNSYKLAEARVPRVTGDVKCRYGAPR